MDNYFNELISELEQCREDERSAQNQQIQAIATAGAILGGIYTIASILSGMNDIMQLTMRILFYISSIILLVAVFYITSLGISNVLRYHYIRNLEDRLYNLCSSTSMEEPLKSFVHWMSFSAPITTRNPLHIKNSIYTIFHYSCYAIATFCALAFCGIIIILQYNIIPGYRFLEKILLYINFGAIVLTLGIFVWISIKAPNMYILSATKALEDRNNRLSGDLSSQDAPSKKIFWKIFLYFLYPKKKDFQKSILIVLGFIAGTLVEGKNIDLYSFLLNGFLCWLLLDFFIYQARYLWNDIRGIREDVSAGKSNRLPVVELGGKKAVIISSLVIFVRLSLALLFMQFLSRDVYIVFFVSFCVIIIISIFYEIARYKKWNTAIFLLVSLGYPIRVFSGFWVANPSTWMLPIPWGEKEMGFFPFILLFFVYMCIGEISAVLPWTHEAVIQIKSGGKPLKSHYDLLFSTLQNRNQANFPLREKGRLSDIWNISYIIGILSLVVLDFPLNYSSKYLILSAIFVVFSFKLCVAGHSKIVLYTILSIITILLKSLNIFRLDILHIFVSIHQICFIILYFILRYYFNPEYDFFVFSKKLLRKAFRCLMLLFIGEDTYNYLLIQNDESKRDSP